MEKLPVLERQLKAISYLRRLEILKYLQKVKTANVEAIAKNIRLSNHATSKHLQQLTSAHILKRNRRGRNVYYRLTLKQGPLMKAVLQLLTA